MNILIVEDEKIAAERLKKMVNSFLPDADIAATDSVKSAVRWLGEHRADLLFLDIQLADGLSFEIFERVEVRAPVIFTTSYDQYAIRAFKVNSLDYLLKPIDNQELKNAVEKFKRMNGGMAVPSETMRQVFEMMKGKEYRERFAVKIGERIRLVEVAEVKYFESKEKVTYLAVYEGRLFIVDYSLDQLEDVLDPRKFYRISRRHIVALAAIEDIVVYSGSRLKVRLKDDDKSDLVVARERVNDFKNWLEA